MKKIKDIKKIGTLVLAGLLVTSTAVLGTGAFANENAKDKVAICDSWCGQEEKDSKNHGVWDKIIEKAEKDAKDLEKR